MKFLTLLLTMFMLLQPAPAGAQALTPATPPDVLIKSVTNEVLDIVRKDKDIQSGNHQRAIELVEAKVLPHFNFTHMTQLSLGRDWRKATPEQQKVLTDEFRTLLVRTYSKALNEYKSQVILFKPFKMKPGDTDVKVQTQISQPGSRPIPLDYYLEKLPQGWTVYDIEVDGISLVVNYRESFAAEVRKDGIDGLIKTLQTKNLSDAGKK
ncbi:putative phospholipid-binding protein MlaC precursor [mine drainage metagenome]|uniref:Putative phospholipid-binding protein MlaC n=1 Tax=mine drainage metagenome TaxID=410659 RepID=A0A1J5SNQ0_9ZZZZ